MSIKEKEYLNQLIDYIEPDEFEDFQKLLTEEEYDELDLVTTPLEILEWFNRNPRFKNQMYYTIVWLKVRASSN